MSCKTKKKDVFNIKIIVNLYRIVKINLKMLIIKINTFIK